MITGKHGGVGKLFDWSKKLYWSHVQYRIRGKSYKMSLTALPVKNTAVKKIDREVQWAPPPLPHDR